MTLAQHKQGFSSETPAALGRGEGRGLPGLGGDGSSCLLWTLSGDGALAIDGSEAGRPLPAPGGMDEEQTTVCLRAYAGVGMGRAGMGASLPGRHLWFPDGPPHPRRRASCSSPALDAVWGPPDERISQAAPLCG